MIRMQKMNPHDDLYRSCKYSFLLTDAQLVTVHAAKSDTYTAAYSESLTVSLASPFHYPIPRSKCQSHEHSHAISYITPKSRAIQYSKSGTKHFAFVDSINHTYCGPHK